MARHCLHAIRPPRTPNKGARCNAARASAHPLFLTEATAACVLRPKFLHFPSSHVRTLTSSGWLRLLGACGGDGAVGVLDSSSTLGSRGSRALQCIGVCSAVPLLLREQVVQETRDILFAVSYPAFFLFPGLNFVTKSNFVLGTCHLFPTEAVRLRYY